MCDTTYLHVSSCISALEPQITLVFVELNMILCIMMYRACIEGVSDGIGRAAHNTMYYDVLQCIPLMCITYGLHVPGAQCVLHV